jgi:hypothetical protein
MAEKMTLEELRRSAGLEVHNLAEEAGVTTRFVREAEDGQVPMARNKVLRVLEVLSKPAHAGYFNQRCERFEGGVVMRFRKHRPAPAHVRAPAAPLPLRFVLPQDQELLEACVAIAALECAFQVVHNQAQTGPYGTEVMAQELALMIEKQEYEGKVGTNDPLVFRRLCIDAFTQSYPIARSLFLEGRMAIDPAWTKEQRAFFYELILRRELGVPAS